MYGLSTGIVIGVACVALVATLAASELLVRGVGRLARNLGLLGGVVGLIVALCADAPEISSSVSAVANGSAVTAAGVVFGSNIFNLAFLLGGAALAAGEIRIHRGALAIDAAVSVGVTLAVILMVLGGIPVSLCWILLLALFVPYVAFLTLSPRRITRLGLPGALTGRLLKASREAGIEGMELETELEQSHSRTSDRSWWLVWLMIPALAAIVLGSILLVKSAVTLGDRWGIASVLVGVVALAAATSIPNAYAAVRLAMRGHGAAVVSATFNSNTLNLLAGIAVPILFFPSLRGSVRAGYVVWLLAMSIVAIILVAYGIRRRDAALLLGAYVGFVVYAALTG